MTGPPNNNDVAIKGVGGSANLKPGDAGDDLARRAREYAEEIEAEFTVI